MQIFCFFLIPFFFFSPQRFTSSAGDNRFGNESNKWALRGHKVLREKLTFPTNSSCLFREFADY